MTSTSATSSAAPVIFCSDLEGVLVPEIWIAVAERTGIDALRRTTRDEPDYDLLMHQRIQILREHNLTIADIQAVIATMQPLDGAAEFLHWARSQASCIIVSDTFYDFAMPLMKQLDYPTLFCHTLEVDDQGMVVGYRLRQADGKRKTVQALQGLGFRIVAVGDSYNDTGMLSAAEQGIFFGAPEAIAAEFPQFPVLHTYQELQATLGRFFKGGSSAE